MVKSENNKLSLRMEVEGDLFTKFEAVRKYLGLTNATEVVRVLVNSKWQEVFSRRDLE